MELLTAVKQWFQEDLSGRINNIINILILLAILSTCSTVSRVEQKLDQHLNEPVQSEQELKKRIVEQLIYQLDQGKK